MKEIPELDFKKMDGLVPAIVQDDLTLRVLMLGYMNEAALKKTVETNEVTFYSRSRDALWTKGETSGNRMLLKSITLDCDADALLVRVTPRGPACHNGTLSCFAHEQADLSVLGDLARTIAKRKNEPATESYTAQLFKDGLPRIAQKLGEEAVETVISAMAGDGKLKNETADLLYHLLVLLESTGTPLAQALAVLQGRQKP